MTEFWPADETLTYLGGECLVWDDQGNMHELVWRPGDTDWHPADCADVHGDSCEGHEEDA